ncbi:hypothetical protein QQ41_05080 [Streptococcus equi subsp. zooepidemicus]|nr:hypothetical protein QQ41_05080 [Streptococcus equi subsp. zooepidemicus]QUQ78447.1 hypothetical protein JDBNIEOD_01483 [Streptococcus equi subsp. zooepidemicus]VTS18474.1 Uncharacterised protein [Streptococcus equi subsp. zooepidemicus]
MKVFLSQNDWHYQAAKLTKALRLIADRLTASKGPRRPCLPMLFIYSAKKTRHRDEPSRFHHQSSKTAIRIPESSLCQ